MLYACYTHIYIVYLRAYARATKAGGKECNRGNIDSRASSAEADETGFQSYGRTRAPSLFCGPSHGHVTTRHVMSRRVALPQVR